MNCQQFKVGDKVRMIPGSAWCSAAIYDAKNYVCTITKVLSTDRYTVFVAFGRGANEDGEWTMPGDNLKLVENVQLMLFET